MNNSLNKKEKRKIYTDIPGVENIKRKILFQFIITVIISIVLYGTVVYLLLKGSEIVVWDSLGSTYFLLLWIKNNFFSVNIVLIFVMLCVITLIFIRKSFKYIDDIVSSCIDDVVFASEKLAVPDEKPIVLPGYLKTFQDDINLIREQSLKNISLAKEAEQRKNDLIVYLAHDLKTPLTSVIGYLSLLNDEPEISPQLRAKYTGIALNKAERLEELINEFFEITRFNLTSITLEREKVNLSMMLEQIVYEFNPVMEEKGLNWDVEIAPNITIVCDANKIERVFDNLINNAINYSYENSTIKLTMKSDIDNVKFIIANHGKTISREKLSRIFEQFYRLDSSRSSKTGGAGLGLAIAKEIVQLHGGNIKAESAKESIVFTVTLPKYAS